MTIDFVDFALCDFGFGVGSCELRIEDLILNDLCGLRTFALVSTCVLGFVCCIDATRRVMIWMSLIGLQYYIKQLMLTVQLIFTMDHHSNL